MTYCLNHDVATGNYDCPYADVVNNSICCNCNECNYRSIASNSVVNNTITCDSDSCISNSKNMVSYQHHYPQSMFNDCLDINDEDYPF